MEKFAENIKRPGFDGWFQANVNDEKLSQTYIARVMSVHKDSYMICTGGDDVFAELVGKLIKSVIKHKKERK